MAKAPAQPTFQQMMAQNLQARQLVVGNSIKMKQSIYSEAITIASQTKVTVSKEIRNSGLLLGFIVTVSGAVTNGATTTATRTPMGSANIVKSFKFNDLSNNTRIQAPGWYLAMLDSIRSRRNYGGSIAQNLPMGFGDNFTVFSGGATIAADAADTLKHQYFLPVAYGPDDLRGAIYMGTVNGTCSLEIELNDTPFSLSGNPIDHCYTGNAGAGTAGWDSTITVTVYQVYLDQLPRDKGNNPILPWMDLSTIYDIKQTTFSQPTASQDYAMPYSNFRAFLSTTAIYDNNGTYNTGSDINYWALQSANYTNLWKVTPDIAALEARAVFMSDPPDGTYFFDSRVTPINTINFGNMELVLNASSVTAGARVLVGFEAFAQTNQVAGATSLGAG